MALVVKDRVQETSTTTGTGTFTLAGAVYVVAFRVAFKSAFSKKLLISAIEIYMTVQSHVGLMIAYVNIAF